MRASKLLVASGILALLGGTAAAQSPAEFYKGKTVDMMIGYSVGGGYDVYARMISRHLGNHIPGNPTVTPKNMEGAGSLRLAIRRATRGYGPAHGALVRRANRVLLRLRPVDA